MSQLETNTTGLQAILAQVSALPDAGNSGSGSLETCNVQITDKTHLYAIAYTTVDINGNVIAAFVTPTSTTQTITCLCNSVVAINHYRANSIFASCSGCELLHTSGEGSEDGHSFVKLTCGAGETATAYFSNQISGGGSQ